jgi:hypothetical protein
MFTVALTGPALNELSFGFKTYLVYPTLALPLPTFDGATIFVY